GCKQKNSRMKRIPVLGTLIALLCFTGSCAKEKPLTIQLLSGTYVAKYRHGTETLALRGDGTFTQQYATSPQSQPVLNEGKWSIDAVSRTVVLDDALLFDTGRDEPRTPPVRTGWSLGVL